jgi:hypothetical protein
MGPRKRGVSVRASPAPKEALWIEEVGKPICLKEWEVAEVDRAGLTSLCRPKPNQRIAHPA